MKKHLLILFAALLSLAASAQTKVEIDGIWYNLISKVKQAEVTFKGYEPYEFDEYSGSISIPSTIIYGGTEYNVTSIGESAFAYSGITSVSISESVTSLGNQAFFSCSSLTSITIPRSVTSIGNSVFQYCESLPAIIIPGSVKNFGGQVFEGCYKLTSVVILEGLASIGNHAFYDCSSLTDITIPESMTSIGDEAFGGCHKLSSIVLLEGLTSIGTCAFRGCSSLTSITIPESVTTIENGAFRDCSALTTITIPQNVVSIRYDVFAGCSRLSTIVLPETLNSINNLAFADCSDLLDVYCYARSVPSTELDVFDGSYPEYATLHVPTSALASYKATVPWSRFGTIVELGAAITRITLDKTSATFTEGEELTLMITTTPNNADMNLISWSSSNPNVATVDNTGKVTAVAPGTATITAMANDGSGVSASCEVTIKEKLLGKCATPVICYANGQVVITCDTEEAKIKSITTEDCSGEREEDEFNIIPTYTITAYATKEKYENSDVATLTLCWIPCTEKHEENNGILTIPSKPVLISTQGGTITVSGLAAGTAVAAYSTAGTPLATATATDGTATLTTNLEAGSIAIVKIGDYSIKVAIK